MAKSRRIHVLQTEAGWAIKTEGGARVSVHKTQDEAVDAAKHDLRDRGGEVVVHGRDGRIRYVDSIGKSAVGRELKDPPRGGKLTKERVKSAVWNGSRALRRT
jgi:Uncharacterized protein conserved in bacteria (DUF2188)